MWWILWLTKKKHACLNRLNCECRSLFMNFMYLSIILLGELFIIFLPWHVTLHHIFMRKKHIVRVFKNIILMDKIKLCTYFWYFWMVSKWLVRSELNILCLSKFSSSKLFFFLCGKTSNLKTRPCMITGRPMNSFENPQIHKISFEICNVYANNFVWWCFEDRLTQKWTL